MFSLDADRLWRYSLQVYANEKVKNACLELQDMMQLNVNIMISMMFLSKHQRMYNFDDIKLIEGAIHTSELKLKKHRAKRRALKRVDEALYKAALEHELQLEKAQQADIVCFANTLFFRYVQSTEQLADQLTALCLRQITDTRDTIMPSNQKYDPRVVSEQSLTACAVLAEYA